MSFEEEWSRAKATAVADEQTRMQLAGTADVGDGRGPVASGGGDLTVRDDELGAVGNDAFSLHSKLGSQGDHAVSNSEKAGKELTGDGFRTGSALTEVAEVWGSQIRTLMTACAHISNHLDYSVQNYKKNEDEITIYMRDSKGSDMTVSRIEQYFQ